jgi:hypothetical protein
VRQGRIPARPGAGSCYLLFPYDALDPLQSLEVCL